MLKVIDLVYYCQQEMDEPKQVLKKHAPATGFAEFIKDRVDISFVKHMGREETLTENGIQYQFFKRSNSFWQIPFKTHRYIKAQRPDIVLLEGFVFPLQLIMLRYQPEKKCKIILQHHGEKPFTGIKGWLQKAACRRANAFLFTAKENASAWLNRGMIRHAKDCYEVQEASVFFRRKNKTEAKAAAGITGNNNFLWVGRLDANKDPLTAIRGFKKFAAEVEDARLYMVYQYEGLLEKVKQEIQQNDAEKIFLTGKLTNEELENWFSAADFYISASHKEGSGYALLEAMACGCIPVVTDIPSFSKITEKGTYGFLYPPGNIDSLAAILKKLQYINRHDFSEKVEKHFQENLGFKNIADDLNRVFSLIVK